MTGNPSAFRLDDITALVAQFEDCSLPLANWTHRAHLTVAAWYVMRYPPDHATERMRSGIQRFNAIRGTSGDPEGGYHETLTLVWLHLVRWRVNDTTPSVPVTDRIRAVVEQLADKNLPLGYYSRDRLMSAEGRTGWVEPDLRPLPALDR